MKKQITDLKQEVGQSMVEYALLIGLIALVAIPAITLLAGETGTATCVQVSEGSSGFFMHEYQKNDDTGIRAIYENATCILGGWKNENVISDIYLPMNGPMKNQLIPIANEINSLIDTENGKYNVSDLKWCWRDEYRELCPIPITEHNPISNQDGYVKTRPSSVNYQKFRRDNLNDYKYVAKLKLEPKEGYEFSSNDSNVRINSVGGAKIKDKVSNYISKDEIEVIIYYGAMP